MANVLCVDDDATAIEVVRHALEEAGHRVVEAHNVAAAMKILERGGVDLVLSDYRMPETNGLEFLALLKKLGIDVPLVMVTGFGSIEHAVSAIKAGAVDYVTKPVRAKQLELTVNQALEYTRLRRENSQLRREVRELRGERRIVGESEALMRVLKLARMVAPTRSTVLIRGESGTGKELIARALHDLSDRADGPFISVNAAALPESLVESALFGHEKGAFTGAVRQVKGAFERAHRGTLLLDEISEMKPELQAKLLRVLQEQEFERVGGGTPVRVDVRIVATTNQNLAEAIENGAFREDLYYRLSVVPIELPPLRDRVDDIPRLAHHFAIRTATRMGKRITGLSTEAIRKLQAHHWPGNVRELAHAVERAVLLSAGEEVQAGDLRLESLPGMRPSQYAGDGARDTAGGVRVTLQTVNIAQAEEALIERALHETGNNRTKAAELLGISVRTLRNKLNRPVAD